MGIKLKGVSHPINGAITEVEGEPYMGEWFDNDTGGQVTTRTKIIYGNGGHNRYFVRGNEVVFSAYHSNEAGITKAKAVGFTIEGHLPSWYVKGGE